MTAYGSAENAVEALKAGAFDYLTKPVDLSQFRAVVASAIAAAETPRPSVEPPSEGGRRARRAPRRRRRCRAAPPSSPALRRLVGRLGRDERRSAARREGGAQHGAGAGARRIGHRQGTGRARHPRVQPPRRQGRSSPSTAAPFPRRCSRRSSSAHRKGAYTGATEDRDGYFQAARGGTLFLDEIGDLPLAMQSQAAARDPGAAACARSARRREEPVDVRIVSATHKDLGADVHGRPLPPGPVLPPERDRDPRAAAARAPRGPAGAVRGAARAHRAGRRHRRLPVLSPAALRAAGAHPLPRQRARTGEPAASRRGADRRRRDRSGRLGAYPSCCCRRRGRRRAGADGAADTVPSAAPRR